MATCDNCQSLPEGLHHDIMGLCLAKLLRLGVLHDFGSNHQALAPDISDDWILLLKFLQPFQHVIALSGSILEQVLVSNRVNHLNGSRAADRVPSKGVRVGSSLPVHQFVSSNCRAYGKSRG